MSNQRRLRKTVEKAQEPKEERLAIQLKTAENIAAANEAVAAAAEQYQAAQTTLQNIVVSLFSERGIETAELVKVEGGKSPALVVKNVKRTKLKIEK